MLGRTIGKYRVVEKISRGGMGTVYKAVDETLDREVAIKVLNPDLGESDVVRRFRAEAMTLARLNHPGIATIYELFRTDDDLLMVMEFVRGETFDRIVERIGPLPTPRAASLGAQVLDALGHAHRVGVVHRDLKPANLMLTEYGSVKIMDFGIARVLGTEHLTSDGLMMGTPAYMAPEQVLATDVDARADLYSVGVVLYRLLSGRLPFKADTAIAMAHKQLKEPPTPLRQYRAELPPWCEDVLGRALAKSPADRFQTAEEFRDALVGHGASLVPVVTPAAPLETTLPPNRTAALNDRLEAPEPPARMSNESKGGPSGSLAPSGDESKEAAYAETIPVPTPVGIEMPRSGSTPPAKSGSTSFPASTDERPAPSEARHSGAPAGESKGPPTSGAAESTTVILQKQHLAVAAGLFALLVLAISGLAFIVMRRPAAVPAASATDTAGQQAPAQPPAQTSPPAPTPPSAEPPGAGTPAGGSTASAQSPPPATQKEGGSSRARDRKPAGAAPPPETAPAAANAEGLDVPESSALSRRRNARDAAL
ncbi:MAG: protein kinase domain-containing protein, partial [Vicinamibacterales bacterium]